MSNVLENAKKDKDVFAQEQSEWLKTMLDARFFQPWRDLFNEEDPHRLSHEASLEIYLTAKCNQKCEYCYLIKNQGLYPQEFDNKETVLKNLDILYLKVYI